MMSNSGGDTLGLFNEHNCTTKRSEAPSKNDEVWVKDEQGTSTITPIKPEHNAHSQSSTPVDWDGVREAIDMQVGGRMNISQADKAKIAEMVIESMESDGTFRKVNGRAFYAPHSATRGFYLERNDGALEEFLYRKLKLNPCNPITGYLHAEAEMHCRISGVESQQAFLAHVDRTNNVLWVDCGAEGVLKVIPGAAPEITPLASCPVVMGPENKVDTWRYIPRENRPLGATLDDMFLDRLPLSDTNNAKQTKLLLKVYMAGLILRDLLPTRPVLVLSGEYSSGKSSTARSIGQIVFGEKYEVTNSLMDRRNLEVAMINLPFLCLDNLDSVSAAKSMLDLIATASTGGNSKLRELFTTAKMCDYPLRSFIAITSMSPGFNRDDIASRVLRVALEKPEKIITQTSMTQAILEKRNCLLSELVDLCSGMLEARGSGSTVRCQVQTRLADFAALAMFACKPLGVTPEQMEDAIRYMSECQRRFQDENNELVELIDSWLGSKTSSLGRRFAPLPLFQSLNEFSKDAGIRFRWANPTQLGKALSANRSSLQRLFGFEAIPLRARGKEYIFHGAEGCHE